MDLLSQRRISDSMVLAVILIATVYWVLDSILNIFFSNKFNLIAELIGPDLYDIYIRIIVLCLLVILGSHAQAIINKLREARDRLNESEELWRSLVETAPDVIMTVDHNGIIRFINQPLSDRAPEDATGSSLYTYLPAAYRDLAQECIENVFSTGETESFEVRVDNHRKPCWQTYRVGPLRLAGRVIAATIISTDTTEFKRAEELMRYKELFDNVADSVFIVGRHLHFIESNDRLLGYSGYTKSELLEMKITDLVEAEQKLFVENMLNRVRQENEIRFELDIRTREGKQIPHEINCRQISFLGDSCFLCVARDIAETKQLQNQLIRSERLAATGQLAASIAHEINSPLQGISALLNVLRSKHAHDDELLQKLDLIKNAFGSIRDTVRNLIDLNRPGKEKKQPMDLNQVIENTVALVRSHLKKNMLAIDLKLSASNTHITASPQQLAQVVMNLVNNAVEAITGSPEYEEKIKNHESGGNIFIETEVRDGDILIQVKDSGPGIAEKDLEHIFDPFFTRKKTMGMGVGLSICHGIIEDHGGRIQAENIPGGGAMFTITLPGKT
jgi:PAS domain S-box-containing protein